MPQYTVQGSDLQVVIADLAAGDKVIAETGHLLALTDGLNLETATGGGFFKAVSRAVSGSSFFINEVTAPAPGRAIFSSSTPGKIVELDVAPGSNWLCQPHVFLCSDHSISINPALTQRFGAGLFGGSGFILQELSGQGKAFIHVGGTCLHFKLEAGQSLRIETGALAAFESTASYDIQMVRGLKSILFSGEGLWFAHLTGPGNVYVQSAALPKLAHAMAPYLPVAQSRPEDPTSAVVGGVLGALFKD